MSPPAPFRVERHHPTHGWVTVAKNLPRVEAHDRCTSLRVAGADARVSCEAPVMEWR